MTSFILTQDFVGNSSLEKSWVGMFNYAPSAELFHCPKPLQVDGAILDVQLLEASAVVGNTLYALITDHFAALDTELLEVGAVF